RGLVEVVLVAAPHPAGSSECGRFGDAAQLHGDVAIQPASGWQGRWGEALWRGRHAKTLLDIEVFRGSDRASLHGRADVPRIPAATRQRRPCVTADYGSGVVRVELEPQLLPELFESVFG